ncbi:hypothetical protein BOX15_Mlig021067g1, partial [Macrostomum lignano]
AAVREQVTSSLHHIYTRDQPSQQQLTPQQSEELDRLADAKVFCCRAPLAELVALDCVCACLAACPEPKRLFDRLFHSAGAGWPVQREKRRATQLSRLLSLCLCTGTGGPVLECAASWLRRHEGRPAVRLVARALAEDATAMPPEQLRRLGQLGRTSPQAAEALLLAFGDTYGWVTAGSQQQQKQQQQQEQHTLEPPPLAVLQLACDWLQSCGGSSGGKQQSMQQQQQQQQLATLLRGAGAQRHAEHSALYCMLRWLAASPLPSMPPLGSADAAIARLLDDLFAALVDSCVRCPADSAVSGGGGNSSSTNRNPNHLSAAPLRGSEAAELLDIAARSACPESALTRLAHLLPLAMSAGLLAGRPAQIGRLLVGHAKVCQFAGVAGRALMASSGST